MKCPYCQKEIDDTSVFCDNCGQAISKEQKSATSDNYWNTVANDDEKRNQEYLKTSSAIRSQKNSARTKKVAVFVSLAVALAIIIAIVSSITASNNAALAEVKENLVGRELKCSYSRTETGFWIHYYYYTLEFNSDGTLDYYYLTTVGPAEKDEYPTHKGTYTYSITRNILGDYIITFANESFTMTVSSDNVPRSLSYGK